MQRSRRNTVQLLCMAMIVALLCGCSSTKHVPQGHFLLDKVKINLNDGEQHPDIAKNDLYAYLRQQENHKVLGGLKLQLGIYNMSGKDSTKWYNRWIQRIGERPVVYDSTLTQASTRQLHQAISNRGHLKNNVTSTVSIDTARRKARVEYDITVGEPHIVRSMSFDIPNEDLRNIILADSAHFPIEEGDIFNLNELDKWRTHITERLRNYGYFAFTKENISFIADTAANSNEVDLTLATRELPQNGSSVIYDAMRPFMVRNVNFVTNYDPVLMHDRNYFATDTVEYHGYNVFYGDDHYLRKRVLEECCYIKPGNVYRARDVSRTYQAFGRLEILRFINIDLQPLGDIDGTPMVDVWILLSRDKSQSVSLSLEGTNSEGDLGFGVGVDYRHRNLFKGSEILNTKFKMSYESISGKINGLINDNFSEYSAEIGLTYPKFKAPFLSDTFKRRIQASTEFHTTFNYQKRPEYTRIIAGAGWKYVWSERRLQRRHTFNLIDLNYVYLPRSNSSFLDNITNPLLRYSYEDHFIMRMGYSYYHTNKISSNSPLRNQYQDNIYTIRASAETAGNLLYAGSKLFNQKRGENDSYKVFGIRYSQYVKAEADYSFTHRFSQRSSISFHVGAGVALPYGNSEVLPFEKRFYAGGANGVRGWGVRTLGPGSYAAENSQTSFIYQCGDIRFDANVEYRAKLFWVIEMAAFIDAGNIWTIKDYDDQPGGKFEFGKFYKQLAVAYGIGIRLDFNYFLLRLDMGMKAHNPAMGQEKWPLTHPKFKRDSEFHFSVGYPF